MAPVPRSTPTMTISSIPQMLPNKELFESILFKDALSASCGAGFREQYFPIPQKFEDVLPRNSGNACELLVAGLVENVVIPLLNIEELEEGGRVLSSGWEAYQETVSGIRAFMRFSGNAAPTQHQERLLQAARKIAGVPGEDEADFFVSTYERAMSMARKISKAGEASDPEADAKLARSFVVAAGMFDLGGLSLMVAASGDVKFTNAGIQFAFGATRFGALDAYSAVHQGLLLRQSSKPEELEPPQEAFSSEEIALALAN